MTMRVDNLPLLGPVAASKWEIIHSRSIRVQKPLSPLLISEWPMRTGGAFRMQSISLFDKLFG